LAAAHAALLDQSLESRAVEKKKAAATPETTGKTKGDTTWQQPTSFI
jgi:hypothetical protein